MLDVHVPQKSEHTWTDFFIHIGTIAIGLLLAIGLEQSVEAIHHAQERRELRAALYTESAQILKDSRSTRQWADGVRILLNVRIAQLSSALRDNRPVPPAPKVPPAPISSRPKDPIWEAAKTSNTAALLDRDELTAYGDLSQICERTDNAIKEEAIAGRPARAYALRLGGIAVWNSSARAGRADLSHASRSEIQEMIERLGNLDDSMITVAGDSSDAEGAAEAIHNGERDITKIEAAERAVWKRDNDAFAARLKSAEAMLSPGASDGGSR